MTATDRYCSSLPAMLWVVLLSGCTGPSSAPYTLTQRADLSVFQPKGDRCEWRRYNPVAGTSVLLASFAHSCSEGMSVAWNPRSNDALVYPISDATPLWHVKLGEKPQTKLLGEPPLGAFQDAGYDANSKLVGLSVYHQVSSYKHEGAFRIEHEGNIYETMGQVRGRPALAITYNRIGEQWVATEFEATDWGSTESKGVEMLKAFDTLLAPRSRDIPQIPTGTRVADDQPFPRMATAGAWRVHENDLGAVAWYQPKLPSPNDIRRALYVRNADQTWSELQLARKHERATHFQLDGPYLLVTDDGRYPELFDLRDQQPIHVDLDQAHVMFWPGLAG